jgi:hypothetical protein
VRRLGIAAAVMAVTLGVFHFAPADAAEVEARAAITREAYFTYPITQTAPPLLRKGFPPATACLVAGLVGVPQLCGNEVQQIGALAGLSDGIPIPITPDSDLAQPTAVPGTTPVGMAGGQTRYVSLAAFNLPALADGQRFAKFELVLHADGLNYSIESPATRELVLQIIGQVEEQDPAKVADAITEALSGEVPLATQTLTGIEACPVTEPWQAGRGQSASLDGSQLPAVDCLTGTTGVYDAKTETWTFDLTFAVQSWTEADGDGGVRPNQGIALRPLGAPNFAYGDPDFSTNWTVSLADSTNADPNLLPRVRYSTVLDDTGVVADPGGTTDLPDLVLGDSLGDFGLGTPALGGSVVPGRTGSGSGTVGTPRLVGIVSHGSTPWWLWLLIPLLLAASYTFDQSLNATPAALRRRPGALTHLEMNREDD